MKTAIFGDINSSYPSLERFFGQTKKQGVTNYYCVGDIVHHNSLNGLRRSDDCIRLIADHDVLCVKGNHEKKLLAIIEGKKKSKVYALDNYALPEYSDFTRQFLLALNDQETVEETLVVHDSVLGKWMVFPRKEEFDALEERGLRMLFFGHSHKRLHFVQDDQHSSWSYLSLENFFPQFDREYNVSNGLHLINPGNLKRSNPPWGFSECGSYVVYDDDSQTIQFKRLK